MKKLLLTVAAVLVAVSVHAQGTVTFANNNSSLVMNALTGSAAAGTQGIVAALYWAPLESPNNFVQIGGTTLVGQIGSTQVPGRYLGGLRTTGPETRAPEEAFFQVRAWESAYGATYEAAIAAAPMGGRPALRGVSNTIQMPTGSPPPGTPTALTSFGLAAFTVDVPEPSVVALGLIGAGALLLLRRRK